MAGPVGETFSVIVKWSGMEYHIEGLTQTKTLKDLKLLITEKTGVLPERQKLLGLKFPAKNQHDDTKLSSVKLKNGSKIMMMGTKEENIAEFMAQRIADSDVIDDFDLDEYVVAIEEREEFLAKIQKRVENYQIKVLNEPREGKKLLVMDVDYTIYDHRSTAETARDLTRPFLHQFLEVAYEHFDIVIWSATSMKWIEAKMKELEVTTNTEYKIMFMLDSAAMITVETPSYGLIETKPLGIIWGKYPQYNKKNSLIIDDLRRNFIMNPQSGLKIKPFRKAHVNRSKDKVLYYLARYVHLLGTHDDFTRLEHRDWFLYQTSEFY